MVSDQPAGRPNIFIIITDQLAQAGVGAYGNPDVNTPNIDRLCTDGVRFDNAYTPCPLCRPARAAFWTGLLPHQVGVLSNGKAFQDDTVGDTVPTVGESLRAAGYRAIHFGKEHDHGALRGFERVPDAPVEIDGPAEFPYNADTYKDVNTTRQVIEFVQGNQTQPFIAVADMQNPHNICGFVGENSNAEAPLPLPDHLPPLPDNFDVDDWEKRPRSVRHICCAHRRLAQAAQWSEQQYRHYIAAYYHYTELVDRQIGEMLAALAASPAADNTLIIHFADHGDGMARHRMVTKHTSFYEETVRIPWSFSGAGVTAAGSAVGAPLVSLLDLYPTLCDIAGADVPAGLPGISLRPYLEGRRPEVDHDHVVSEWYTEWGYTIEPGRMLRTERFKYMRYAEENAEELYDLQQDPGEKHTLIDDPAYADELQRHRDLLQEHAARTADPFFEMQHKADARWRSHAVGYTSHEGPSAPTAEAGV